MLRRLFIRGKNAVSPVLSLVLALAIVMPTVGTILIYGLPAINDLSEDKESEKGKAVLGSVTDEIRDLANSGFRDSTTVNFDLGEDSSISIDQGTDRTVLMYSIDQDYVFDVSDFDDEDSKFTLDLGESTINTLKANYYFIDPRIETCFLAGTKILMADGSYKNIECARVGDLVKSYDEETGKLADGVVTHVFPHTPDDMGDYYLVINNQLSVTPNHRFYSDGKWVYADDLKIGDSLFTDSGHEYIIYSIDKVFNKVPTFDLEIESCHTYFVSFGDDEVNVLVHNSQETQFYAVQDVHFYDKPGDQQYLCSYLKFDISAIYGIPIANIISVKLRVYVTENNGWTGNILLWNVENQDWDEGSDYRYIWSSPTSDRVTSAFDGASSEWWESEDIKTIFMVDYSLSNSYCSLKMENPSYQIPGDPGGFFDYDDYLSVGFESFKTASDYIKFYPSENERYRPLLVVTYEQIPDIPSTPNGQTLAIVGMTCNYDSVITDPDGDQVYYNFSWGDGTYSGWLGPVPSGTKVIEPHSWSSAGAYDVKVKALDATGQSDWSEPLSVTIRTNANPTKPSKPSGNLILFVGESVTYSTNATDSDGDNLLYWFDWGDGTTSGWVGPYVSEAIASVPHAWSTYGTQKIRVKAIDTWGAESVWSDMLTITVKARPTVVINESLDGKKVRDTIIINGTANDSDGNVDRVEIKIDEWGTWKLATGKDKWDYLWKTTDFSDGYHTIYARSYDNEGYYSEDSVYILVINSVQEQGISRIEENGKINRSGPCIVTSLGSGRYELDLQGHDIRGTGVIDLYDSVSGDDSCFGSIWFFDSDSMTYAPSGDRLSSLIVENGIIVYNNTNSPTIADLPNVVDKNKVLSMSIYQLVKNSSMSSVSGGSSRILLKSYESGMSVRDRFHTVYDFKIQFYGDNRDAWIEHLINGDNYQNFDLTPTQGIRYTSTPVNLVLWHTYIEFGMSI